MPSRGRRPDAILAAVAALAALALLVAAVSPETEIALARHATRLGAGVGPLLRTTRAIAIAAPPAILAISLICCAVLGARDPGRRRQVARAAIFLVLTFVLGPGLLVNGLLKPHSHRPRPSHTLEVAGTGDAFRPFYSFDGACLRNCSFASGEAAAAFWTVAPAFLAPAPMALPAACAALAFGTLVGGMRMMAGAHFLSDIAFSAIAMLALVAVLARWIRVGGPAS